MLYLFLIYII